MFASLRFLNYARHYSMRHPFGAKACDLGLGSPLINLSSEPNGENQNDYFLVLDLT